jgi:hypothetical protein
MLRSNAAFAATPVMLALYHAKHIAKHQRMGAASLGLLEVLFQQVSLAMRVVQVNVTGEQKLAGVAVAVGDADLSQFWAVPDNLEIGGFHYFASSLATRCSMLFSRV